MVGAKNLAGAIDAVCIGETMVSFVSTEEPVCYRAIAAGAESNVAMAMARMGCRTSWLSRVGDDPLGRLVEASVGSAGVDVTVVRDPDRPTGVMVKHVAGSEKVSSYYRSESAARALGPDDLQRAVDARWIHVTGITPALSASARELVHAVVSRDMSHDGRVSFDVNYRPRLWPDARTAAETLLPLARSADVVFVGDDEAHALFDTDSTPSLVDLILRRDGQELVVKRGRGDASVNTVDGEISVPAMPTHPVDVTGAGDAFAAGYLAASCFDWPVAARLRLGHVLASRVVASTNDALGALTDEELEGLTPAALASQWEGDSTSRDIGGGMSPTRDGACSGGVKRELS
jgi:2-dehydro-3-deoxygluconokinase